MVRSFIQISEDAPSFPPELGMYHERTEDSRDVHIWWKQSTGEMKLFNSASDLYDIDVKFDFANGCLSTGGDAGITETFDSAIHTLRKLKVQNGMVTELEVE